MNAVRVFLNPKSGQGDADQQKIAALLAGHGCRATFTTLSRNLDVKALAASDPAGVAFIAAGGDGTVNCVASGLVGSDRPMGVLALGTLNHFARDLGLPVELEPAIAVIAAGRTRPVDAAEVNGRIFVNNSSLGVYPRMVVQRERMKQGGVNKWASLVLASARAFIRFKGLQVDMNVEGQRCVCTTPFLFIGNNDYCLDGLKVGERAHLDAGHLALYLAPGATRMDILRMAFGALLGRIRQSPVYEEIKVREFSVAARHRRKLRAALDGEVVHLACPLRYRTLPGALRVLCPATGGIEP